MSDRAGRSRPAESVTGTSAHRGVPDVIAPDLRVLFCGINPGTLSGQLGQHFARPGNRFWKLLHASGFTDDLVAPAEQEMLPARGVGITNLVERATAAASAVTIEELREGAVRLEAKAVAWRPRCVAVLGLGAYRTAFRRPKAMIGRQPEPLGSATLWLLPNPSGLQARYQFPEMTELFRRVYLFAVKGEDGGVDDDAAQPPA
jgi:TDG/mug DNA glycosylase family protein